MDKILMLAYCPCVLRIHSLIHCAVYSPLLLKARDFLLEF
jgi:hypothetical protein